MQYWITFYFLLVIVSAEESAEVTDQCKAIRCVGKPYKCIEDKCYCADGYIQDPTRTRCMRCPGFRERCYDRCCDRSGNATLQCWQGFCQKCYDTDGVWTCRDSLNHILLVSSTQVVMATSLVLGIIATFILLSKLCAATSLRPLGNSANYENRLSIGSLQIYVEERLRDAPPRYSRTPPTGTATSPMTTFTNSGFIHDNSTPPPPYTQNEIKSEDQPLQNSTIHI